MANKNQTYGNWQDIVVSGNTMIGHGSMEISSQQLLQSWQRCSLASDFWARYIALSSSEFEADHPVQPGALEGALSFILNELLENAAKFSAGPMDGIIYGFWLFPDWIIIQVTNHITPESQDAFVRLISDMLGNDAEGLYFKRLEEGNGADQKGAGLGYLTLMNDYRVRFGFRFTPVSEKSIAVDVQAHICLNEIPYGS